MAVRLAINPITWVNDDMPSLGAGTSLETILSESREAGFAVGGVEAAVGEEAGGVAVGRTARLGVTSSLSTPLWPAGHLPRKGGDWQFTRRRLSGDVGDWRSLR